MESRAISPKQRADFSISASDGIVLTGFFNERELEIFFELIQHRRQLPVFHGDFWRCYDCVFESEDFEEMGVHIIKYHEPGSINVEDKMEREFAAV
ncbi:MAG: hypothetical protein ABSG22_10025 [Sedimentisphaerales bacterium]|jgi:hypothetical protein